MGVISTDVDTGLCVSCSSLLSSCALCLFYHPHQWLIQALIPLSGWWNLPRWIFGNQHQHCPRAHDNGRVPTGELYLRLLLVWPVVITHMERVASEGKVWGEALAWKSNKRLSILSWHDLWFNPVFHYIEQEGFSSHQNKRTVIERKALFGQSLRHADSTWAEIW